jgi:DNA-binding PadR family transcriptional regulator
MGRDYQPQDFISPNERHNEVIYDHGANPRSPSHDEILKGIGSTRHSSTTIADRPVEPRQVYELSGRIVRLRSSEVATMIDVGKFRAIDLDDLREFSYQGNQARLRPDIENLVRQRLVQIKSVPHETKAARKLLALTSSGRRLLRKRRLVHDKQILYDGFGRPRDAHHDADLYRLYQKAAHKIERVGGRNLHVILDYELKDRVSKDLTKLHSDCFSIPREQAIAASHELRWVAGKIPIPDVRIEYETAEGGRARVDLELVTNHYRLRNLLEKVQAGFSVYAYADDLPKLRRILDQRELTAEILSL